MTIPSCVNPCSVCQLDSNIHQHTECLNVSPCFHIVLCVFQNGEFYIFHYWGVQHSLCTVCSGKETLWSMLWIARQPSFACVWSFSCLFSCISRCTCPNVDFLLVCWCFLQSATFSGGCVQFVPSPVLMFLCTFLSQRSVDPEVAPVTPYVNKLYPKSYHRQNPEEDECIHFCLLNCSICLWPAHSLQIRLVQSVYVFEWYLIKS